MDRRAAKVVWALPQGIRVQKGLLGHLEATEGSSSAGASLPCQLTPLRRAQKQWLFFLRE